MRFLPPLAGHTGYNPGNVTPGDSAGDGGGSGGLGAPWIFAAIGVALIAVALLVWLSPGSTRARLRALAPKALILVLIAAPLVAWAAASQRGGGEKLIVETTDGRKAVRIECFDRDGQVVLDAEQRWPFRVNEAGYDYPHVHQAATREQLQQADRCELRGTRVRLEADVKGVLPS
jgi:membrane protein implicated in regulation of membrane protease activity